MNKSEVSYMYFIRDYEGPKPYKPSLSPDVLIIGQDPTVDQYRRFDTVLGLEKSSNYGETESKPLQIYIKGKILKSLDIDESRIVAVNLINAYYYDVPNRKIAKLYEEQITKAARRIGINVDKYPEKANGAILHALNFEYAARKELEQTLSTFPIKHVITLGEPVYQVVRERYDLELAPKIKDVLKSITKPPLVVICKNKLSLLPLPHIFNENNTRWKFYKDFINIQLPLLAESYKR